MIEIRTYDGDARDVTELVNRAWPANYAGQTWFPMWDQAFFEWQLLAERPGRSDLLVAAYENGRLLGCLFAESFLYRLAGREIPGAICSWLTIDPDCRVPAGWALVEEMRRRYAEHGMAFGIGYVMGDRRSSAFRFWQAYGRAFPDQVRWIGKVGFWVRILDYHGVARQSLKTYERVGLRALGFLPNWMERNGDQGEMRAYREADLADCLECVNHSARDADLATVWTTPRLAMQLDCGSFPRTLVHAGSENQVGCLVNYHPLKFAGRGPIQAAVIDLVADREGCAAQQVRLLRAACRQMAGEGVQLALALRSVMCPARVMLAAGFIPRPAAEHLVCVAAQSDLPLRRLGRYHLLFR